MDNLPQHTSGVFLLRPMVGFYSGVDMYRRLLVTTCVWYPFKGSKFNAKPGSNLGAIQHTYIMYDVFAPYDRVR